MERNVCKEIGCPAACCRNIYGQAAGRSEFFRKAFPMATGTESIDELKMKIKNRESGVYYHENRGWVYFAISGDCPNLDSDVGCKIHGRNFYPKMCANLVFGGSECHTSQQVYKVNLKVFQAG